MALQDSPLGSSAHHTHEGPEALQLSWRWPSGLIGLSLANFVLRIVTAGIYSFWATTETRKRIWSGVRINEEPFTYTGRGLELFIGALLVLPILLAVIALNTIASLAAGPESVLSAVFAMAILVLLPFATGLAIYRSWRYRLGRTRWRGIRASLAGNQWWYAWTYLYTLVLIPLTLGWIIPWRTTKLQSLISNAIQFGNRPLQFEATATPLYGPFAISYFGTLMIYSVILAANGVFWLGSMPADWQPGQPVLVSTDQILFAAALAITSVLVAILAWIVLSAWYRARTINHFAAHTSFENARFSASTTAWGFIWIGLTNALLGLIGMALFGAVILAFWAPFIPWDVVSPGSVYSDQDRARLIITAFSSVIVVSVFGYTLFAPIMQARSQGYIAHHMSIDGTADLAGIAQTQGPDVRFGEGLAGAFDVDAF